MQRDSAPCEARRSRLSGRRVRAIGLAVLVAVGMAGSQAAVAAADQSAAGQVAVASRISGTVERLSQGNRIALHVGDPVHASDHILTSADGRVRLQFPDGSTLVVGPASDLQVAAYDMKAQSQAGALLRLAQGIVRAIVDSMPGNSQFRIAAPTAVAAVRGTSFIVQADKDNAGVFVIDGFVYVDTPQGAGSDSSGDAVTVQNSQGTDVPRGGKPGAPGPWSTERIQAVFALTKLE